MAAFTVLLLSGCSKKTKVYSIQGRVLQSSSNPVPLSNYKLTFFQPGRPEALIPIGASSASTSSFTNNNGFFSCRFQTGEATFLLIPLSNSSPLSMRGDNNDPLINLSWSNIPAKDTVLGDVYVYKKINKAVIKIISSTEILPQDSLIIRAPTALGEYRKVLTGISIQPNTIITADTILQLISTNFDVPQKQYFFNIYCDNVTPKKSDYNYTYTDPFDEPEREFLIQLQ